MQSKRVVRFDQVFLIAAGCLIVGYLLGIGTAVFIQGRPTPSHQPVAARAPAVAPPSSALGSYSAEIGELRNIVERDPGNYDVWLRLGNTYFDTDQYMESIEAYTRALEIRPGDPNVITDRAIMYRRIGDFERAAAGFREAAALDPTHLNSALNLGVVLRYDMNDVAGATQAWQMYLDRNPPPEMAEKVKQWIQALQTQE